MITPTPYRPSNGTEGEFFIESFCCQCARSDHLKDDREAEGIVGCEILGRTFSHDIEDPQYPKELIEDERGPRCTAYVPEGQPLATPRCAETVDMFGEQSA